MKFEAKLKELVRRNEIHLNDETADLEVSAIIDAFVELIGPPINIRQKYETTSDGGVDINTDKTDDIAHLAKFAEDTGRNAYRAELLKKIGR